MKQQVQKSIQSGLRFLATRQTLSGRFNGFSSSSLDFNQGAANDNIFFTALIAYCVSGIAGSEQLHKRAAEYLLEQCSNSTTWNYWQRGSTERSYPDDLDDTACAITGIIACDSKLINAASLAKLAQSLISCETRPGGPYTTWLVHGKDTTWRDIDVAVNANIGLMFAKLGITSQPLVNYISDCIASNNLSSPYYVGDIPTLYFIARWYRGPKLPALVKLIKRQFALPLAAMHRAMLITALYHLGEGSHIKNHYISDLLQSQQGGMWPASALYYEPPKDGRKQYAGSVELSTGFVIEALYAYTVYSTDEEKVDIRANERREVAQIANVITTALGAKLDAKILHNLNQGSIHGWAAYTIYDDILDGDADENQRSAADDELRSSIAHFKNALPQAKKFHGLITISLKQMDSANSWELRWARDLSNLPNYNDLQQLATRSQGHLIAPIGALLAHGFSLTGPEVANFRAFMQHYIIAKQLCDDAHDWQEDIAHSRATAVVVMLLRDFRGSTQKEQQAYFWQKTILEVHSTIRQHLHQAQKYLDAGDFFLDVSELQSWLIGVERICERAEKERDATLQFIQSFTQASLVK